MTGIMLGVVLMSTVPGAGVRWGGYYTQERVAAIRGNAQTCAVVKHNRDAAVRRAQPWLAMSDEELWDLVPGQNLPRCIDVTLTRDRKTGRARRAGCLVCGDKVFKFGNYPYRVDVLHHPWKIQCPSCKSWFPTNDFEAYWRSARDETGFFNPRRGKRSLLFNTEHPDPGDPLRSWGVDDGFGYKAPDGQEYRFIAYYTWKLWTTLEVAALSLGQAYVYTGDRRYAHKAAVLLDRIADAYPDMDWAPYAARGWLHSDGGSGKGKIEGAIWECVDLRRLAETYDMVKSGLDSPRLYAFLRRQAARYKLPTPKGTRDMLMRNIENRILRCGAEAVIEGRIRGNEGMHHSALAWAAIALDQEPDTSRYLDWLFAPDGGHLPAVIMQRMDRDGVGEEGGPGYALSWAINLEAVARLLSAYKPYGRHDLFGDFPRFRNSFVAGVRMTVLDYTTPPIGDSMATGAIGKVGPNVRQILGAFRACGDPRLAVAAWIRAERQEQRLWIDDEDAEPAKWAPRVKKAVEKLGERCLLGPDTMNGYGLVSLEAGTGKQGTAVWMYYGQNYGHAHRDRLNFGLYSYGLDLAPDLGYPEFAANWPKRNEWTDSTISHNTVLVDETPQSSSRTGTQTLFKVLPAADREAVSEGAFCQVCEVSSPEVYKGVSEYRRMLVFVPLGEAEGYVVDIFRVVGGEDHIYSFHGPPGEPQVTGLTLVPQGKGTYAGPDVPFGPGARGRREGFSWLYDVRRQEKPPAAWSLDFTAEKGYRGSDGKVHLAMHFFSPTDEVALAHGDPPQNKHGNPRRLPYVLARRKGHDLQSCFVAVFDPWREQPHVRKAQRVPVKGPQAQKAVALRLELADGSTDWLLSAPGPQGLYEAEGGPRWSGRLAQVRVREDRIVACALVGGTFVSLRGWGLRLRAPAREGKVVRFDHDMAGDAMLWTDCQLPPEAVGQELYVKGDPGRNPAYRIHALARDGDLMRVDCGPVDFIRGFRDLKNYDAGYVYEFEEGAPLHMPNHALALGRKGVLEVVETTDAAQVIAR